MKIIITADPEMPVPPVLYGGIERIVDALVRAFREQGHTVCLVAHPDSSAPANERIAWPGRTSRSASDSLRNALALRRAVRAFRPDVLHSFSRLAYLLPLLPAQLPKIMSYQRLTGGRQITGEGKLDTTIRYFPNALRALGDAFSAERLPRRPRWLGEREIDLSYYEREVDCDWTSGSFMMTRREAIESAGFLDERYFMYSDETDFCRRIKTAGWEIRHLPLMTILHHDRKAGVKPHIEALGAYTRVMYARKFFSPPHRWAYAGAVALRALVRSVYAGSGELAPLKRAANRHTLKVLLGRAPIPFGPPSRVSVRTGPPQLRELHRFAAPLDD